MKCSQGAKTPQIKTAQSISLDKDAVQISRVSIPSVKDVATAPKLCRCGFGCPRSTG